jgi:uncharacterized membrane protein YhaH (DUF805 family)
MTRDEAIAAAPSSRRSYWWVFGAGLFVSLLYLCGAGYTLSKPISFSWVLIAGFAVMSLITLQSWERLFHPEHAAERSASLTAKQRKRIETARTGCLWAVGLLFVAFVIAFMLPATHHSLARDFQAIYYAPMILAHVCSDLLGERLYRSPASGVRRRRIPVQEMKPIQSEHWGEGRSSSPVA